MNIEKLEDVRIAKPCKARWKAMAGNARKRFCASCKLHVYNVTDMTRDEAMKLIRESEGRVCLRVYRRFDGTVLTKDCPVGVRADRRRKIGLYSATAVLLGFSVRAAIRADNAAACSSPVTRSEAWVALKHGCYDKPKDFIAHTFHINSLCTCGRGRHVMGW